MLGLAGYTPEDLERTAKFDTLKPDEGCALAVKLFDAPSRLPTADGGLLARYVLLTF